MAKILKMSCYTIDRYWNRTFFLQKEAIKIVKFWILKTISSKDGEKDNKSKLFFEEIKGKGFNHSIKLVYDFVKKYPKTIVESLPEAAKVKYYSSKQLSIWLSIFRKDWSEYGRASFELLRNRVEITSQR